MLNLEPLGWSLVTGNTNGVFQKVHQGLQPQRELLDQLSKTSGGSMRPEKSRTEFDHNRVLKDD